MNETEDDATSISSNVSLLSKTGRKRKSISRRFSIVSKQRHGSAIASMIYKNRLEYRENNHSKRLKGFEECREVFLKTSDDDDDDDNGDDFQLLEKQMNYQQHEELFPLDFVPSEKFEILAKHTTSEHPYSNEPTAIEAIEANESSSLSLSFCQSKTMPNIMIYGKIPRITVNETPQRELIRLNHRSGTIWFKLMDLTKQIILILILIVVYASYVMSNFLIRKNE